MECARIFDLSFSIAESGPERRAAQISADPASGEKRGIPAADLV
jgi:hypothetical protein